MSKTSQKGYINFFLLLILIIGTVSGVYLIQHTTNILPRASEKKDTVRFLSPGEYASMYITSARKNIITLDGKKIIFPSKAYVDSVYIRDTFYALVGLADLSLSEDSFSLFEQTQGENGQIRYAVPLDVNEITSSDFKDDESNLIYLIWAGILNRQGISVNVEKIEKAYSFIKTHAQDGWFISPPGDYRYWADTYNNKENDTISYNQGLYVLSLRFLKELNPELVSDEIVSQAEENFRFLFKDGSLPLSRNTDYQDASSLLPEFLARFYFDSGMLEDNQVIASVDKMINLASVYDEKGSLQGIKTLYGIDGSFLPYEVFQPPMNNYGVYQNGGYWPMHVLADLSLAYKISGDNKYKDAVLKLMEKELGNDGKSKEFLYLEPRRIGTSDSERSDYSWNALVTASLKWSGMIF